MKNKFWNKNETMVLSENCCSFLQHVFYSSYPALILTPFLPSNLAILFAIKFATNSANILTTNLATIFATKSCHQLLPPILTTTLCNILKQMKAAESRITQPQLCSPHISTYKMNKMSRARENHLLSLACAPYHTQYHSPSHREQSGVFV